MEGFRDLSDPDKLDVTPDRVRIRSLPQTQTLRRALLAFGTPGEKLEDVALLNGMYLDDTIAAGTLVKVIEVAR
jgi:predicted Zn-dependent protease